VTKRLHAPERLSRPNSTKVEPSSTDNGQDLNAFRIITDNKPKLTEEDIPRLREQWLNRYKDSVLGPIPNALPPMREINHTIPLIDEHKDYRYHLPRCADTFKRELWDKTEKYLLAGWWKRTHSDQAMPMLCIPKRNGSLRTPLDCRKRNDNTVHDVTPLPDQEQIRLAVAGAKYRTKFDVSNAFEQVRIEPDDIWKTSFASIYGTYTSLVMQQGDCNAPATFQRLMTWVLRDGIGIYVWVYLDDIFIYSNTIEEHEEHIRLVMEALKRDKFYLSLEKCEFYSKSMDCLGHVIDDDGIHASEDKMDKIRNWPTPENFHDVQRFLGLVQYLAHFMPDVSAYTGPLAGITRNGHEFEWTPLHEKCFESIKQLICRTPILKPIDPNSDDPIWVICDASTNGIGALYGQGPTWQNCRPAGMMSRKFTPAQQSYRVFEHETIAILEALLKWEDRLIGKRVNIVTDHKALEFFKSQRKLSNRQSRWMEFLSRFNFDIQYIEGVANKVADSLSRYYANAEATRRLTKDDLVTADIRLDPDREDLPLNRVAELNVLTRGEGRVHVPVYVNRRGPRKPKPLEPKKLKRKRPSKHRKRTATPVGVPDIPDGTPEIVADPPAPGPDQPIGEIPPIGSKLSDEVEQREQQFIESIKEGYKTDPFFQKIVNAKESVPNFWKTKDGLVQTRARLTNDQVTCLPRAKIRHRFLSQVVLEAAHEQIGHLGANKTAMYIRRWYWWPRMRTDIDQFCLTCGLCQTTKDLNQNPQGLLHSLPVPHRPWESIAMDFVGPFPDAHGYDYIWVVLCRLTSQVHLIPTNTRVSAVDLAFIYLREVVRLHGLPKSIVSDRDSKFTSRFWQELHRLLGTRLLMSTAFHPQTDGHSERMIRTVSQILRSRVDPDQLNWAARLPLVEFALNSSINVSTGYAPFELSHGYMPRLLVTLNEADIAMPGVKDFAKRAVANLAAAHDLIIESRVIQTHFANQNRREEPDIEEGDKVYLSTKNLSLPRGRARKLMPRFIGPYTVLHVHPNSPNYTLDLPAELRARNIHTTFHISRLRYHHPNDGRLFPHRDTQTAYDFGETDRKEWLVDEILSHRWNGDVIEFEVLWNLGDRTWEPKKHCRKLAELRTYLALHGVESWQDLPRDQEAVAPVNA
jgi:transposase InsO family protein